MKYSVLGKNGLSDLQLLISRRMLFQLRRTIWIPIGTILKSAQKICSLSKKQYLRP
jgi:hypothetical protein